MKSIRVRFYTSRWRMISRESRAGCLCEGRQQEPPAGARYGINAPALPYSPQKPRYIRITDITEAGTYSKDNPASVEGADIDRYYLKENDIVAPPKEVSTRLGSADK